MKHNKRVYYTHVSKGFSHAPFINGYNEMLTVGGDTERPPYLRKGEPRKTNYIYL